MRVGTTAWTRATGAAPPPVPEPDAAASLTSASRGGGAEAAPEPPAARNPSMVTVRCSTCRAEVEGFHGRV